MNEMRPAADQPAADPVLDRPEAQRLEAQPLGRVPPVHAPRVEELGHQRDAVAIDDAQRHVVVDPEGQPLVEAAEGVERGAPIGAQRVGDVLRAQRRAVVERRRTVRRNRSPAAQNGVARRPAVRVDIEEVAVRLAPPRIAASASTSLRRAPGSTTSSASTWATYGARLWRRMRLWHAPMPRRRSLRSTVSRGSPIDSATAAVSSSE